MVLVIGEKYETLSIHVTGFPGFPYEMKFATEIEWMNEWMNKIYLPQFNLTF